MSLTVMLQFLAFVVLGVLLSRVLRHLWARYTAGRTPEPPELRDLLSASFMQQHTRWSSFDDFERDSGLPLQELPELGDEDRARLDALVRENSRFASMPEMLRSAMSAWLGRPASGRSQPDGDTRSRE